MRGLLFCLLAGLVLGVSGCGGGSRQGETGGGGGVAGLQEPSKPEVPALKNEIPPGALAEVLKAHQEGLGHMERYVEYAQGVEKFREVHRLAPGFIPGSINLAIALLNTTGTAAEAAKESGEEDAVPKSNFDEALELLDEVIERDPTNRHAHYSKGVILEYIGQLPAAYESFKTVSELDPMDGHTLYKLGSTMSSKADPTRPAGPAEAKELIAIYTKALECNPYLVPAIYKLQMANAWDRQGDRQKELLALWRKLNPKQTATGPGDPAETVYGEMGQYATVIDWSPRPKVDQKAVNAPRFDVPERIRVSLPEGHRWVKQADFAEKDDLLGRYRERFGAGVAAFDAEGNGTLDLYLTAAVAGPDGVIRDALLLNQGDGRFEEVAGRWGVSASEAHLGVAAGDFDADGLVDLFLAGAGHCRLLRNVGNGFEDVTETAGLAGVDGIVLTGRWLDLDQDGDLDLYLIRHGAVEGGEPGGVLNLAFRNDGQPAPIPSRPQPTWSPKAVSPLDLPTDKGLSISFAPWVDGESAALGAGEGAHTGVASLDIDSDRDLDLVAVSDDQSPLVILNDRLGRFREVVAADLKAGEPKLNGVLVADFDRDGRQDLAVLPARGRLAVWRNRGPEAAEGGTSEAAAKGGFAFEFWASDAHDWRSAEAVDLDLDGAMDLIGLPVGSGEGEPAISPEWARNTGSGLKTTALALGPDGTAPLTGMTCVDVVGDALPDLVLLRDGEEPRIAKNLGNGHHWLALELRGRWKFSFDRMRTNVHGLGAEVTLQGPELFVPYLHTTSTAGLGQSVAPTVLGMGTKDKADLLRITWPDGVMQCELNQEANQRREVAEYNRKTGSCPVLFTFDGERFVCIGDFLGGGGLGYLVAPGVYSEPDRDEAVAIGGDQLAAVGGVYRVSVTEPMDEVAYIDKLILEVIDRPPGTEAAPVERFAPGGNRPSGELVGWKRRVEPAWVTDLSGKDLGDALARTDRRTADGFERLGAWIGYTQEHGIVLDFGDRLAGFGPGDRLMLGLQGWVEYPYSQTNYAAATAGVALQPPVLERLREDGTWEILEADPGYPAGLPRLTLLELTGKLAGERCVLRLKTNMECYWDEAFVAVLEPEAGLRVTALEVATAELGARGYTREVSPDGRLPLLYDYDYVDPAPLARLEGKLTRFGEVAALLRADDDQFCLVGPGDEARIEFDASRVPSLPEGWTRSYVLRSTGYCKDADPFTAASDTVGPLPWRGMGAYPFGPAGERPPDAAYEAYLKEYQTRAVGGP